MDTNKYLRIIKNCIKEAGAVRLCAFILLSLVSAGIACLIPFFTKLMTGDLLQEKKPDLLLGIGVLLIVTELVSQIFSAVKSILSVGIRQRAKRLVENTLMEKVMRLPGAFFRSRSLDELTQNVIRTGEVADIFFQNMLFGVITSLSSLLLVFQIYVYAPALLIPSLCIIAVTVAVSVIQAYLNIGINKSLRGALASENAFLLASVSGITRIRQAGAEKQIYDRWEEYYNNSYDLTYKTPLLIRLQPVIVRVIKLIGGVILYYLAAVSDLSQSDYLAFMSAYAAVLGAFISLCETAESFAGVKPVLELAKPVIVSEYEDRAGVRDMEAVSGNISLDHVSFGYSDDKKIINDLSLDISAGEYIGIVGKTGCGKTTLLRLITGFERPDEGRVLIDGTDLNDISLSSFREHIGAVVQNGELLTGDIFSNITAGCPNTGEKEAWEAADAAGIADEIRKMPLGMKTPVAENSVGFSEGQKQRILIARAIIKKPAVLIFDEATGALDNVTRRKLYEYLKGMKCTRIVISHRRGDVEGADRIIYMENGTFLFK